MRVGPLGRVEAPDAREYSAGMIRRSKHVLAAFVLLVACTPAPKPTVEPGPGATPSASATPSVDVATPDRPELTVEAAPAPTAPASTSKPASTLTIGGKSLSSLDVATLKAALEKAGYAVVGPEEIVPCGDSETLQLSVTKKGKPMGLFSLQRPTAKPDACKGTPVKEAHDKWKPSTEGPKAKNAIALDEAAGVLVAINLLKDEPGAAKKLLDALLAK